MRVDERGRRVPDISRRSILAGAGALAGLAATEALAATAPSAPRFSSYPFTLGIASGDPLPDGFVLWTRLAPEPVDGGGMPPEAIPVEWQLATDDRLRKVVRRGTTLARPELAYSVHVELRGLEPGRRYWYRFRAGSALSPVGRTRTAPVPGAPLGRFRFAFASCQHYEQGYFSAYRHMLADDLDLVVHLGDYIYEVPSWADEVRRHEGPEPITLADYRNRHALYKLDPDLQAAHAAYAWVVTWDDHDNPHIRFFESRKRGYVRCELTPESWRTDLRVLDGVRDRLAPIGTLASFVVENGRPGAERA